MIGRLRVSCLFRGEGAGAGAGLAMTQDHSKSIAMVDDIALISGLGLGLGCRWEEEDVLVVCGRSFVGPEWGTWICRFSTLGH